MAVSTVDREGVNYSPSKDSCSPSKEIFHKISFVSVRFRGNERAIIGSYVYAKTIVYGNKSRFYGLSIVNEL